MWITIVVVTLLGTVTLFVWSAKNAVNDISSRMTPQLLATNLSRVLMKQQ